MIAVKLDKRPRITAADLTPSQREIMAWVWKNGGIHRNNRLWGIAPTAVHALIRKGYLKMNGTNFAQLTEAGFALMERTLMEGRKP